MLCSASTNEAWKLSSCSENNWKRIGEGVLACMICACAMLWRRRWISALFAAMSSASCCTSLDGSSCSHCASDPPHTLMEFMSTFQRRSSPHSTCASTKIAEYTMARSRTSAAATQRFFFGFVKLGEERSHTRTRPSLLPLTRRVPWTQRHLIASRCPSSVRRRFHPLGAHTRTRWSAPPETRCSPDCASANTGPAWALTRDAAMCAGRNMSDSFLARPFSRLPARRESTCRASGVTWLYLLKHCVSCASTLPGGERTSYTRITPSDHPVQISNLGAISPSP
mmetsp:Transcript_3438/g.8199  ORF Transcript_3438/g.8199 Transcript_3438/m.8199 type:complete len:282 (+) Transcript_3438:52-897(+)